MDSAYYCHASAGAVLYDPGQGTRHFDPWYALLVCDEGIIDYLAWFMRRQGRPVQKGSRWGAHVTFVRGEPPPAPEAWGKSAGEAVEFHYSHAVRWTNGWHAWVDVWCPRLTEIRFELGLVSKSTARYHLTLGRLAAPEGNEAGHGGPAVP